MVFGGDAQAISLPQGPSDAVDLASWQERVRSKGINEITLLATDYLNHFNEIIMLLEILPDMPDCLEEVRAWQPKSYAEHFRDSVFTDRDLAILAYENAPARYREPFDQTVAEMDRLVLDAVDTIAGLIAQERKDDLAVQVAGTVATLGRLMDRAGAIIHGDSVIVDQQQVDSLMG